MAPPAGERLRPSGGLSHLRVASVTLNRATYGRAPPACRSAYGRVSPIGAVGGWPPVKPTRCAGACFRPIYFSSSSSIPMPPRFASRWPPAVGQPVTGWWRSPALLGPMCCA
ncbi:hypothetical protein SETIT_7G052700v2 [Setaria italica]|uniref:Uncharacterized protein n=1 Tax=Setaria italica TaxID=4555 RepID=A0A368RSE4_SETIT|nr:hypothetical protein SETIT_7G052700v2 [Setaria italica]